MKLSFPYRVPRQLSQCGHCDPAEMRQRVSCNTQQNVACHNLGTGFTAMVRDTRELVNCITE